MKAQSQTSRSRQIRSLDQIRRFDPGAPGRLHSATHEEIRSGATADVYLVKTLQILRELGRQDTHVVAEVFASRPGLLAGIEEVRALLAGSGLRAWSLPEGAPFEAKEVVLRLEGRFDAYALYETALLGMLASASGWATAAAEAKAAAGGKPVICFGARHVHPAVAPVMERSAVIGGADGASCILAARLMGRMPQGTVPHALMLLVGDTVEAARAYDRFMPPDEPRTILVDTFKDEAEESLRVAAALAERLGAVRLDTPAERGRVTPGLVREVRARLDQAGYSHVRIFVSGGLDPQRIQELDAAGADGFGVGSFIAGARAIDMTLDVKEVSGRPLSKRGRIPGRTDSPRLQELALDSAPDPAGGR